MVFTPWVDNDVSMHKVVGLVVLIPASPTSSKTESGCKRYRLFCATRYMTQCTESYTGWVRYITRYYRAMYRVGTILPPTVRFLFAYKRGFFPNSFLGFLTTKLTSIAESLELSSSPFPPMILAYSWGIWKRRSRSTIPTNQFLL